MSKFITTVVDQFSNLWSQLKAMRIVDFLDIILMSIIIYYAYKFIKTRRAAKLAIGLVILLLVFIISDLLNMYGMRFLLSNIFQIGLIAIVILFQPELRAALEKMGAQPLKGFKTIAAQKTSSAAHAIHFLIWDSVPPLSTSPAVCSPCVPETPGCRPGAYRRSCNRISG